MTYKEILETAVKAKSFKISACLNIESVINTNITIAFEELKGKLSSNLYKAFKAAIIRSSFLIELTDPTADTDSTKYQVRWVETLRVKMM